jgi:hypothetical protein
METVQALKVSIPGGSGSFDTESSEVNLVTALTSGGLEHQSPQSYFSSACIAGIHKR